MCSNHSHEYSSTPFPGNKSLREFVISDRESRCCSSYCIVWCCCHELSRLSQWRRVDVPCSTVDMGAHVQSPYRATDDTLCRNVCINCRNRCEFVYSACTKVKQPCRNSTRPHRSAASWNIAVSIGLLRAMDLARHDPFLLRRVFHHRGSCICVVISTSHVSVCCKHCLRSRPFMVARKPIARWQRHPLALTFA